MNELTNKVIPSELDAVAHISNAIVDIMELASARKVSNEAVILAVIAAAASAVERADGMEVDEELPQNLHIKVVLTRLNAQKLSS